MNEYESATFGEYFVFIMAFVVACIISLLEEKIEKLWKRFVSMIKSFPLLWRVVYWTVWETRTIFISGGLAVFYWTILTVAINIACRPIPQKFLDKCFFMLW